MILIIIKMKQTKRIVFTQNNWTPASKEALLTEPAFTYVIVGEETGASGTPHLQGYAEFAKVTRYTKLAKKHLNMHCEQAITQAAAIEYCKKDGLFEERGQKRPDESGISGGIKEQERWKLAYESAKTGDFELIPPDILMRYYRTIKEIAKDNMVRPDSLNELQNLWIYGDAGTGKTRLADAIAPVAYSKNCNKWWDGYQSEETVIINDFGKDHHVLGHHLKIWSEHRPFIAETKGGALNIRPKRIIVTSQYSINDIWQDGETRDAMARRFTAHHLLTNLELPRIHELALRLELNKLPISD